MLGSPLFASKGKTSKISDAFDETRNQDGGLLRSSVLHVRSTLTLAIAAMTMIAAA
jgi:hypothetical protein